MALLPSGKLFITIVVISFLTIALLAGMAMAFGGQLRGLFPFATVRTAPAP